ncbi:hypothetical protein Daus18300_009645 [Diaporthe australafricana]|uniref:Uncharacterized protein n=1 Tax=Diaporthe australafricana TaxID=127596 RepID=A0ABR3WDV3_9PEZI
MDTIEVKVRPSAKKSAGGADSKPRRRGKRQASTTPTRLTRAMLKKLNENGGPPVKLDPGLEMAPRRRSKGSKSPKEATPDEAVSNDVQADPTVQESGSEPKPSEKDKIVSESEVAAASRLAQAAIAAGLTKKDIAKSPRTSGDQRATGLVQLTKDDLRQIFKDAIITLEIKQDVESHWLARTEFLTWWQRPIGNIDPIKEDVRRLVYRWGLDLQQQIGDDVEIPVSLLESWRADTGFTEDNDLVGEVMIEEPRIPEPRSPEPDVGAAALKSIKESFALAKRDLTDWKHFFDGGMSPERPFRSKRFWGAVLSDLQAEAEMLQEKIRKLDVYSPSTATESTREAADSLLRNVQEWRGQLQKDQDDFQDEMNREEEANRIDEAQNDFRAEEDAQMSQPEEEKQETEAEKEENQTAEVKEDHGSSTEDIVMSGVEPAPAGQAPEGMGHDDTFKPNQSAHASEKESSQEPVTPVRSDESMLPTPTHINDEESDHGLAGLRETDADQFHISGDISSQSEEEKEAEAEGPEGIISERLGSAAQYKESVHDEEVSKTGGETQSQEAIPEASPERIPEASPEASPEATLVATPERTPEANPEAPPERIPEVTLEEVPEGMPKATPETSPEAGPDPDPEALPERILGGVPRATPERITEATPEVTPEREPDVTPERVSEAIAGAILGLAATPQSPYDISCPIPPWERHGRKQEHPEVGAADEAKERSLEIETDTSSVKSNIRPGSSTGVEATPWSLGVISCYSRGSGQEHPEANAGAADASSVKSNIRPGSSTGVEVTPWPLATISCPVPPWERSGREQQHPEANVPAAGEAKEPFLEIEPDTSSVMSNIRPGSAAGIEGGTEITADHTPPPPYKAGSPQDSNVGSSSDVPQAVSPRESPDVSLAWRSHKPQWEDVTSHLDVGLNENDYSADEVDDDEEEVYDYLQGEEEEEDDFDL